MKNYSFPRPKSMRLLSCVTLSLLASCSREDPPPYRAPEPPPEEEVTFGPEVNGPIVVERIPVASSGGSTGDPIAIELALCDTSSGYSVSTVEGSPVLDDFEDGDTKVQGNGRAGEWYTYGDDAGSVLTEGSELISAPGQNGAGYALHAGGNDFSQWGSGVGVGLAYDSGGACLHDLSVYSGVSFWVRGRVETFSSANVSEIERGAVRVLLTEAELTPTADGGGCDGISGECWDSHRARFSPGECWQRYSFDFAELEQDGWGLDGGELSLDQLYNLNFEVAAYNNWEMWVDDITFYIGEKPEAAENCEIGEAMGGASGLP